MPGWDRQRIVSEQVAITLQNLHLVNPNGPVPVAYGGKYPPFGSVPPGHLLQIKVPQSSTVLALKFVKIGGSTDDCLSSNPNAVVTVLAGHATSASQIKAIYGTANPAYSTSSPIPFVACLVSQGASIPGSVQIQATIISQ